ncbi:hypothetical protein ACFOG5_00190 [Pedobacter fastidiosus]|uniref:hypothetical protein n=1 Tax=Pedobacter fastidiosus TaxID=2765361 RepID=UPI00361C46EC
MFITGTMYQPSGQISRFTLFLISLLALPFLFLGMLGLYVSHLDSSLIEQSGRVRSFRDLMGRGTHHYTFSISPSRAVFDRAYHTPMFSTAQHNINALSRGPDGSYRTDTTGQLVDYYVFASDLSRLNDPRAKVDFFYLRSGQQRYDRNEYYYDVLVYATGQTWFYFAWTTYLLMEVSCFASAWYCYKMYALDQQKNNRLIWSLCLLAAAVLNVAILLLML